MRTVAIPGLTAGDFGLGNGGALAAPLPKADERAGRLVVNFKPIGRCPKDEDVRHIVAFDLSGSLGGPGGTGNDPAGLRFAALLRAAETVAAACRCGRETLQVFSFDLTSEFEVGPVPLNRQGIGQLREALSSTNVGWGISTLGPSLAAARQSVAGFEGKVTITVASDFLLTDVPNVLRDLAGFPADSVHALVLTAPVPPVLGNDPSITVTAAGWSDKPAIVAEALYQEFVRFRRPAQAPRKAGRAS